MSFAGNLAFVDPTVGTGTGAGTLGDPWNLEDVAIVGNPKGMGGSDTLGLINDQGVYTLTDGVQLQTIATGSTSNNPLFVGCNSSGKYDGVRAILDATNKTSGNVFNINNNYNILAAMRASNGPAEGIGGSSSFRLGALINVWADGNASYGIHQAGSLFEGYFYCKAFDNGDIGLRAQQASAHPVLYGCHIKNNGGTTQSSLRGSAIYVIKSIIDQYDTTDGINSTRKLLMFESIIRPLAAASSTVNGIKDATVVFNSIFSGMDSGGDKAINDSAATVLRLVAGTTFHSCDANFNIGPTVGSSPYDTTDPVFTSTTDNTPTVDMTGKSIPEETGDEAVWKIPGPIQPSTGGGGGGGLLVHPGMNGGMRG